MTMLWSPIKKNSGSTYLNSFGKSKSATLTCKRRMPKPYAGVRSRFMKNLPCTIVLLAALLANVSCSAVHANSGSKGEWVKIHGPTTGTNLVRVIEVSAESDPRVTGSSREKKATTKTKPAPVVEEIVTRGGFR